MRGIEFRGRDESGRWYYGGYADSWGETGIYINTLEDFGNTVVTVNEKTIGEYIGLNDDFNGAPIYEGDIINCIDSVKNEQIKGCVEFRNASFCIVDANGIAHYRWIDYKDLEIVGNIHDEVVK